MDSAKSCYTLYLESWLFPEIYCRVSFIKILIVWFYLQVASKYGMPPEMIKNVYKKTKKG